MMNDISAMNKIDKNAVEDLIEELHKASEAYYLSADETQSELTDEEFDAKLDYLTEMRDSGNFDELFEEGTVGAGLFSESVALGAEVPEETAYRHKRRMLSLKKAKTEAELVKFLKKMTEEGAAGFSLQAKLDGFALSALYENGQISKLVTRGDGEIGEDVTYLLNDSRVSVVNLPEEIEGATEIRGEIFFTDEQFEAVSKRNFEKTGDNYKNSRNAVVGLMAKSKLGVDFDVEFTFGIYSAFNEDKMIDLAKLTDEGVTTVLTLTEDQVGDLKIRDLPLDKTVKAVEDFGKLRENFSIPTDGVVVKPSNEVEMNNALGDGSNYPNSQIAFKYPGATAETVIVGVDLTVGRTGKVNPIGRLEPVLLNGTTISNVSLHNFAWIKERGVKIGSRVSITRANDVIPYLKAVIVNPEDAIEIEVPEKCPSCESDLQYEGDIFPPMTLRCNSSECPSKDIFALYAAVGKNVLDIDGMSHVTIDYLHEVGKLNDVSDLYSLTMDDLKESHFGTSVKGNPRTLGEKRSKNILEHIEKSKNAPLHKLIQSISVNGAGNSVSKDLVKRFKTIEGIMSATKEELLEMDGIGETLSENIIEGFKKRGPLVEKMIEAGVAFNKEAESGDEGGDSLSGLSFAISGSVPEPFSNRNSWVAFVESNGGEFHSSPKVSTSFFIGDPNGSSSKIKKAVSLGVEFISPEDFTARFAS